MYYPIKSYFSKIYSNLNGWTTKRKIVVFESDDWGSIRMPSRKIYEQCIKDNYRVDNNPYEKFDSLESEKDLEELFNVLSSFKDKKGNHPIFTANCVVANPDFKKIEENDYNFYHYEIINETFQNYPNHKNSIHLWKKAEKENMFCLQFHGREHLNTFDYIQSLKSGNKDALYCFKSKMLGIIPSNVLRPYNNYVEATNYKSEFQKNEIGEILVDGFKIFNDILGRTSESYIPTNYIINPSHLVKLKSKGLKYVQGNKISLEPNIEGGVIKNKRILGQQEKSGLITLVRNCRFEPTLVDKIEIERCLKEIELAFMLGKPAVICSHRVNYIGGVFENNRDENLKLLNELLNLILKRWPEVEFLSTPQLGQIIEN